MQVYQGTAVAVSMAWTGTDNNAVDPASVVLKFGYPGNVTTWTYGGTGEIVKVGVGLYTANISTDGAAAGTFLIVAEGEGTAVGATSFSVLGPPL